MLTVHISGVPECDRDSVKLDRIINDLKTLLENNDELDVDANDIFIYFPTDRYSAGLGEEILADITCPRPENITEETVRKITSAVYKRLKEQYYPNARVHCRLIFLPPHCECGDKSS